MSKDVKFIPQGFSGLKIKKVKFSDDKLIVKYKTTYPAFDENGAPLVSMDESTTLQEFFHKPHQHLASKLNNLRLHVLFLCGYLDTNEYDEEIFRYNRTPELLSAMDRKVFKMVENVFITTTTLGGSDEEGVIVTAQICIEDMQTSVNINAPFLPFASDKYAFMDELQTDYNSIEEEVFLYMGGKKFFDGQLDLFENKLDDQFPESKKPAFGLNRPPVLN